MLGRLNEEDVFAALLNNHKIVEAQQIRINQLIKVVNWEIWFEITAF